MSQTPALKLPKWIYICTLLLGIFGIGMGLWSAISPMGMFNVGHMTLEGTGRDMVIYLFAGRNFGFGVLFLIALLKFPSRDVLLTIYIARFVVDIADTLSIWAAGMMAIDRGLEQLIFLIPIPIIILFLFKAKPTK